MSEKVRANVSVFGGTPAVNSENAATCPTCPYANSTTTCDKDEICRDVQSTMTKYVDRCMDQLETAMYDEMKNEVKHRPATQ